MKKTKFPQEPKEGLAHKCPKCEYPHICPCKHCVKTRKKNNDRLDIKPWIWVDGEHIKCPNCGHMGPVGYWESWEYECITEKFDSLTDYIDAMRKENET